MAFTNSLSRRTLCHPILISLFSTLMKSPPTKGISQACLSLPLYLVCPLTRLEREPVKPFSSYYRTELVRESTAKGAHPITDRYVLYHIRFGNPLCLRVWRDFTYSQLQSVVFKSMRKYLHDGVNPEVSAVRDIM